MNPDIIGYIAASLTTFCFIPQAVKAITSPDTKAISLSMYIFFNIGILMWLTYGILLGKPPIILANAITTILTMTILAKKVYNVREGIDKD